MKKELVIKPWAVILLLAQIVVAIMATATDIIYFKIGVAGIGVLLLILAYNNTLLKAKDMWLVLIAFLFSMVGDCFLSNMGDDNSMFIIGIALYLLAHLGYLFFSLYNGFIKWKLTIGILLIFLVFYYLALYNHIQDKVLASIVLFYLVVSCISVGAAFGIKANPQIKWPYVLGIGLILFSDTIISFKEFVKEDAFNFLILPTYYLAQISITIALYYKSKEITPSTKDKAFN